MKETTIPNEEQNDSWSLNRLFGAGKIVLRDTTRAVTPFGGLSLMVEFFGRIGLIEALGRGLPYWPKSPNAYDPRQIVVGFLLNVIVGARRFAHLNLLRADRGLHALLGMERFPCDDTFLNFFRRFEQPQVEMYWRPLWRWMIGRLPKLSQGYSLDLDSTIIARNGRKQEGANKGYNPRRPGRLSHHPLVGFLAEAQFVLHAWLRSGNTGAGGGVVNFLKEALAQLGNDHLIRCVRADSGFCAEGLMAFLEERGLSYIIAARMSGGVKSAVRGIKNWQALDPNLCVGSFQTQLQGWSKPRRFVVIRERVREGRDPVGRKLIDVDAYTFRVFVTDRADAPEEIWRDYNQRALVECRIDELKNEMAADGFCLRGFYASESAFLAVLFAYNLLSEFQRASAPKNPTYKQPATLRLELFTCGAILGRDGHRQILHMSLAWGGVHDRKPLFQNLLNWPAPTSPKLPPEPPPTPALQA